MEKVTNLNNYKTQKMVERINLFWKEQFGEDYNSRLGFFNISNKILFFMAQSEKQNAFALYTLIMRALNLGTLDFYALQSLDKLRVIDIQLYFVDRARFEMMKRLDWLESYCGQSNSFMELIGTFEHLQYRDHQHPPQLSSFHENYKDFEQLINREKIVYIRKLFLKSRRVFEERFQDL